MNYPQLQAERAARSSTSPFHRAVIALRSDPAVCLCLLEGPTDAPFYRPLLRAYTDQNGLPVIRVMAAGNKNAVLYARDKIGNHNGRARFIVDKDHDDLVDCARRELDLYVTDYYSVESYFHGLGKLADLFADIFSLNNDSTLILSLNESYARSFSVLATGLCRVHARIVLEKILGSQVHISNVAPHTIFKVSEASIDWSGGSPDAASELLLRELNIYNAEFKHDAHEVLRIASSLRSLPPVNWLHGKFSLYHACSYLNMWYKSKKNVADQYGDSPSLVFSLNTTAILNRCATFHGRVASLSAFLDRWDALHLLV